MTTTSPPQTPQSAWAPAVTRVGQEFSRTSLPILSGRIPAGLRGTLYRNSPARLQRGGEWVGHWFDGDGAILAVDFTDTDAFGPYRFVQTQGYLEESEARKFLYGSYGMKPPGPIWEFWIEAITENAPIKNTANTSVLSSFNGI